MKSSHATTILTLLVLAIGINYVDRGSLSVAKTEVSSEFQLDPVEMGMLFSAFFWSYALCQIAAGWLVDRHDVKLVFTIGFLIWSLATLGMGLLGSFTAFFALRLLLGAGESVAYPAASRVIVANFAEQQRGFANALIDAASKVGPALSTLLGGLVVARWGWRSLFIGLGGLSLLWLIPWLALVPSAAPKSSEPGAARPQVGIGELLQRRQLWGTSLGFFCLGYAWYFLISWLPSYLQEERGMSKESMAVLGSLPFWAMAGTALLGGWLSDLWIARGATPTRVRMTFLIVGLSGSALCLAGVAAVKDQTACLALLIGACAALGLYTSNAWAVTQTLAGPLAAGQWSGIQNAIGNMGGVVSPVLTGWIVKQTGSFALAFAIAAGVLAAGILAYLLLVGRVAPLTWRESELAAEGS